MYLLYSLPHERLPNWCVTHRNYRNVATISTRYLGKLMPCKYEASCHAFKPFGMTPYACRTMVAFRCQASPASDNAIPSVKGPVEDGGINSHPGYITPECALHTLCNANLEKNQRGTDQSSQDEPRYHWLHSLNIVVIKGNSSSKSL